MALEMLNTDKPSAAGTMGVMSPLSVATATAMSTDVNGLIALLTQLALTPGTVRNARADALMMTSFTENLSPCIGRACVAEPGRE